MLVMMEALRTIGYRLSLFIYTVIMMYTSCWRLPKPTKDDKTIAVCSVKINTTVCYNNTETTLLIVTNKNKVYE